MGQIEPNTSILEDGTEALIDGTTQPGAPSADDDIVSFAELNGDKGAEPIVEPAAPAPAKPAAPAPTAAGEDDDLPEQFRGKSKKELIEMYQNAHSTIGRQGSELAKFRQYADAFLRPGLERAPVQPAQPAAQPQPAERIDDAAVFAKPIEAIDKLIEQHPAIQEIKRTLGQAQAEAAVQRAAASKERFDAAHPDAPQILQDPEFRQWVAASPIRRQLLLTAHRNFNFEAGDELFGTWKALHKTNAPAPAADGDVSAAAQTMAKARAAKAAQQAAAQAATVPTGGASGAAKGGASKRIYRRADLIELQISNPDRYEAMQDEISAAYAEGRVR